MIKRDTGGSVWDWQLGRRTLSDGTKVPLEPDSSFKVLFEHQLIGGQALDDPKNYYKVSLVKTGLLGCIRFYIHTTEDVPLVDDQGEIVRFVIHGHVELTWEEKDD